MITVGSKVKLNTPFARVILGGKETVVTSVRERGYVVRVHNGAKLLFRHDEVEEIIEN